ncbi:hypothetical protein N7488_002704 [Penicillium malachiteum]|nr:hypothetical protein N7488_002704 [Penicillium malachiteum]
MASTNEPVPATDAREEAQSPPSDNDGGERPVRQQLKQTSIQSTSPTTAAKENGRKRSFDESRDDQANPDENGDAPRKRSREGTPQDENNVKATTVKDASAGANSENVSDDVSFPVLAPLEMADKSPRPSASPRLQASPQPQTSPRPQASAAPDVCDPQPLDLEEDCTSEDWMSMMDKEIASALRILRNQKAKRANQRARRTSRPKKREADEGSDVEWADIHERIIRQVCKTVDSPRPASRGGGLQPADEGSSRKVHGASESSFDSVREYLEGLPDSPIVGPNPTMGSDDSFDFVREYLEGLPDSPLAQSNTGGYSPQRDAVREYLEGLPEPKDFEPEEIPAQDSGGSGLEPSASYVIVSDDQLDGEGFKPDPKSFEVDPPIEVDADEDEDEDDDDASWATALSSFVPSNISRSDMIWDFQEEKWTPAGQNADLWARYCRETKANKNLQDPIPSIAARTHDTMDTSVTAKTHDTMDTKVTAKTHDSMDTTVTAKPYDAMDTNDESTKGLTKKRSREQLEVGSNKPDTTMREVPSGTPNIMSIDGEPEKKKHRDNSQEPEPKADNGFAASAFGKAVGASPFVSLGNTQQSNFASKPTSSSAFANSTFSTYGTSVNSSFCPPAVSQPSVFMSASAGSNSFGSAPAPATTPVPATSGIGAMGSGFAGVGGGFGAATKPGGGGFGAAAKPGLASLGSNNAPLDFVLKPKFIRKEYSDDESDGDGDDEDSSTFEASKTDERFYEQTIETGEEAEETVFTCKAKLFHFANKEWKERGIGTFKINVRQTSEYEETARMIMRADGAGRVILNSPIFEGMNYGGPNNAVPTSKQVLLSGIEEGRTVPLLLRTQSEAMAVEIHEVIEDILTPATETDKPESTVESTVDSTVESTADSSSV